MKILLLLFLLLPLLRADETREKDTLKIHFISGSREYQSAESLKKLQAYLEKNHSFAITASWVGDKATDLPGIESIKAADVLVVFARRLKLPEEQMKVIRAHWEANKGVVGIRTASHAFSNEDNKTFDLKILGGNYDGHYGDDKVTINTTDSGKTGLAGNQPFPQSSKLYKAKQLGPKTLVLQTGSITNKGGEKHSHPVTWINSYSENGRAFYTSLGVPSDFDSGAFLGMLARAIHWSAHLKGAK